MMMPQVTSPLAELTEAPNSFAQIDCLSLFERSYVVRPGCFPLES